MKKIMNRTDTFVYELINGIAMTNPAVEADVRYKVIRRKNIRTDKVSLISGGGSGHEPAHAGYVGRGMLDATVCGDIFASPTQIQVYQGIRETRSDKGTLLIIKNYSGDVMNFRNGAALAEEEGCTVDYVVVDDDIAVNDSLYTIGRRGVAGTVLVEKIAGAAAEEGLSLKEVKEAAIRSIKAVRSIGFALSSCTVPAKGTPTFEISDGEMEYGVGIHGEPGIKREKILTADELADRMTAQLLTALDIDKNAEIALMVNGFGGTALQELYVMANAVRSRLADYENINVYRSFVGNYMTSIEMKGASLTFMVLDETLKHYLDAPCEAPAFQVSGPVELIPFQKLDLKTPGEGEFCYNTADAVISDEKISLANLKYMTAKMGECIIQNETEFCEIDSFAGDGDFGASVAKGFRQVKREWERLSEKGNAGDFLRACGMIIIEYCGGASGPIWGSAFLSAAKKAGDNRELSLADFAEMFQEAVKGIQKTGERSFGKGASVGDKTLIDALVPCADSLSASASMGDAVLQSLRKAAGCAQEGARATENIVARMGRAGVVGARSLGHPDAGAYALGVIFDEVTGTLK